MSDEGDPRRDALHAFLQQQGPEDKRAEGALLTGWAIVVSWVDPDGDHWLTKAHASTIPTWTATGMFHEALYSGWGDDDG